MKKIIIAVLCLCFSNVALADPNRLEGVVTCLQKIYTAKSPEEWNGQVSRCYDLALPWANSQNVVARAVYMKALLMYLGPVSKKTTYQLNDYYSRHLAADLTSSFVHSASPVPQSIFSRMDGLLILFLVPVDTTPPISAEGYRASEFHFLTLARS